MRELTPDEIKASGLGTRELTPDELMAAGLTVSPMKKAAMFTAAGINQGILDTVNAPGQLLAQVPSAMAWFYRNAPPLYKLQSGLIAEMLGIKPEQLTDDAIRQTGDDATKYLSKQFDLNPVVKPLADKAQIAVGDTKDIQAKYGYKPSTVDKILNLTGQGIGASVLPSGLALKAAQTTAPATSAIGRALVDPVKAAPLTQTAANVVSGATAGTGSAVAEEAFPGSPTAKMIGGLIGGILPSATYGLGKTLVDKGKQIAAPFTEAGKQKIAADMLRKHALDPDIKAGWLPNDRPPLPTARPTLAQQTNDPGLLALQRTVEQKYPAPFQQARSENNQAVRGAIANLAGNKNATANPKLAKDIAASNIRDNLEEGLKAAANKEKLLWDALGKNKDIGTVTIKSRVNDYVNGLPKAYQDIVPADIIKKIVALEMKDSVGEVTAIRSLISDAKAVANRQGQANVARILDGLDDVVLKGLDDAALKVGDKGFNARYLAARQATADKYATFKRGEVGKVLKEEHGLDRYAMPDAKVGDRLISDQGMEDFLKAVAKSPNPDALKKQAQQWLIAKFQRAVDNVGQDLTGDPFVKSAAANRFVKDNLPTIQKLFTPDQQKLWQRIADQAMMNDRVARAVIPGGPDTAAKLEGSKMFDGLISEWLTSSVSGVPGLGKLGKTIVGAAAKRSGEDVQRMIAEALIDPAKGMRLLRTIDSPGNRKLLRLYFAPAAQSQIRTLVDQDSSR